MATVLTLTPVREKVLSASAFLQLTDEDRALIEDVQIQVPQLGLKGGFAKFKVRYKYPVYERLAKVG